MELVTLLLLLLAAFSRLGGVGRLVIRLLMLQDALLAPRMGGIGMWVYAALGSKNRYLLINMFQSSWA